jgi:hypothetical protein
MVSSSDACARRVRSGEGELTVAADLAPTERGSAETGPAQPIATIALDRIAAAWRKFDRETASFGVEREYVVILLAPWFGRETGTERRRELHGEVARPVVLDDLGHVVHRRTHIGAYTPI